jgi:hypothetical protein
VRANNPGRPAFSTARAFAGSIVEILGIVTKSDAEPILAVRMPLGVSLGGVFGMLGGVQVVTVREMRMMTALFVVLLLMMLRRLTVVLCRLFVVLRGLLVMPGELG